MKFSVWLKFIERLLKEINPRTAASITLKEVQHPILLVKNISLKNGKKASVPNTAYMQVTNYCDEACKGCYVTRRKDETVMPSNMIDAIIRDGENMRFAYYTFLGGEPFSQVSRDTVIEAVRRHPEQRIVACTNAKHLDDFVMAELSQFPNFSLFFSLDGFEGYNDHKRSKGAFKQTVRAMEIAQNRKMISGVMTVVTKNNHLEVSSPDYIEFLIEKGIMYIAYSPIIGKALEPPTPDQYADFINRINGLAREYPILIHSNNFGRLHGSNRLNLMIQGLRAININPNGIVSSERDGRNCRLIEPPNYSLKDIILSEEFQRNFQHKFHGNYFEDMATRDQRYPLFGETLTILKAKGYEILRPVVCLN